MAKDSRFILAPGTGFFSPETEKKILEKAQQARADLARANQAASAPSTKKIPTVAKEGFIAKMGRINRGKTRTPAEEVLHILLHPGRPNI